MAFKTATIQAFKKGFMEASPVLLEPIASLTVTVPDDYTGDVMGDLNKRRGRVLGMNPVSGGKQEIVADIPMTGLWLLYSASLYDRWKRSIFLRIQPLRAGTVRCAGSRDQ